MLAFDINILLIIDEVYLSKQVEASGESVFGLTEECEVTSAALHDQIFIIKLSGHGWNIYLIKN